MRILLIVCLGFLLAAGAGLAPREAHAKDVEAGPGELTLATERVVIFKDGYSLFVRKATGTADAEGNVHTFEVPDAAVLGSFWAFSAEERLLGMKAELVTERAVREEATACLTMVDLLRANRNALVTIARNEGDDVTGVVAEVLERPGVSTVDTLRPQPQPGVWTPHGRAQPPTATGRVEQEILPAGGALVRVRAQDGTETVLPTAQIRTLTGRSLKTQMTRRFESKTVRKRLSMALGKAAAGQAAEVTLVYFTPGLRWIPTYRLSGELESKGDLSLQAEILNEVMDLDGVAADMVVGVPHFKFREVISPLSLEMQLRNVLRQAAPQLMSQQMGNAYFASRAGESQGDRGASISMAPELGAAGSGDLFVYSLRSLTLRKGGRATVPLWQSRIPLAHLYTLDIMLGRDARGGKTYVRQHRVDDHGRSQNPQASPLELAEHKVWHQFQLKNETDVPWTTGAALTMRGTLPLGQDMLTYTSIGAEALLPLTVAVDVCAEYDEEEVERVPNAATWGSNRYARIVKQAKVKVCNYRKNASRLRVTLALGGKVTRASDDGTIKINDFRVEDWSNNGYAARGINNHSDVEWNLELAPGEVKYLELTYEFFAR